MFKVNAMALSIKYSLTTFLFTFYLKVLVLHTQEKIQNFYLILHLLYDILMHSEHLNKRLREG